MKKKLHTAMTIEDTDIWLKVSKSQQPWQAAVRADRADAAKMLDILRDGVLEVSGSVYLVEKEWWWFKRAGCRQPRPCPMTDEDNRIQLLWVGRSHADLSAVLLDPTSDRQDAQLMYQIECDGRDLSHGTGPKATYRVLYHLGYGLPCDVRKILAGVRV